MGSLKKVSEQFCGAGILCEQLISGVPMREVTKLRRTARAVFAKRMLREVLKLVCIIAEEPGFDEACVKRLNDIKDRVGAEIEYFDDILEPG